jgi:AraC-like DNA-binding protein
MLMIPLPFVLAMFVAAFLCFEWLARAGAQRGGWLLAFLALLVFQEVLVGLRFGYGVEWLRMVQPLSAALLPPLAYLSFRRPALRASILVHLLPMAGVLFAISAMPGLMDTVLAAGNLFYAAALIRMGLRGADGFGWAETHRTTSVMLLLWLICGVLLLSGLADAAIAYDFRITQGDNTGLIAGWTTAIGIICVGLGALAYRLFGSSDAKAVRVVSAQDGEVFATLGLMMDREQLHLDADINLNRVARRLIKPSRDVSRAINVQTGGNFSQYINGLRIEEACKLLGSDMPITQIVFASGFNTKSNFNREFSRITGKSPSDWRSANE